MASEARAVDNKGARPSRRRDWRWLITSYRRWWRHHITRNVDQDAVIASRREEAVLSGRYMFMLTMSAGIAVLGLLLSSPAVVIGAMLLSPLMGPIIGLGFALATGDYAWLRKSLRALAVGTALGIAFTALIVAVSPLQTVTAEIAARTRPNLFDLFIALFSALAGAYAMIRGREGTIVGVAIATALMPPLAVVGFGLATLNWTVFSGALLLYVTNLVTIALTAMLMARLYGFHTSLSRQQTRVQDAMVVVAFLVLSVPLALALNQIRREAAFTRQATTTIASHFADTARISEIDFDFDSEPVSVAATVLTPSFVRDAEASVADELADLFGRPVHLTLDQFQVGTSALAAEQAQLAAARLREREAVDREAREIATQLASVAGVEREDVLIDREARVAEARIAPIAGAGLRSYADLESRLTRALPGWRIVLIPPAIDLPTVTLADGAIDDEGAAAVDVIAWAAGRIGAPVALAGNAAQVTLVRAALNERGVGIATATRGGRADRVEVRWAAPDSNMGEQ